jgi:hypothetical protein
LANTYMAGEIERGPTLGFPEQQPAFEALEHAINWATSCAICPSWRFTECATPTLVALLSSAVRFKLDERVRERFAETRGNPLALIDCHGG